MPLPMIFPGDEITVLYKPEVVDGDPLVRATVVVVHPNGDLDLQDITDPDPASIWTALKVEEERGDFRIVDVHPAPKPPLTQEDVQ